MFIWTQRCENELKYKTTVCHITQKIQSIFQINKKYKLKLSDFNGGNLRNAIAREAFAIISLPENEKESLIADFYQFVKSVQNEYLISEPGLKMEIDNTTKPEFVFDAESQKNLLNAIYASPHGVLEMSTRMDGMVETSTNLAAVKIIEGNKVLVTTSQRSEIESRKYWAAEMVESVFKLAGAEVRHTDGYPGWAPNPDSEVVKITVDSYKRLFGVTPIVRSIHAGLECGLFLEKYPHLDMVSFGPTIRGAHSPDERLDITTTEKFWKHLVDVLENIQ